MQSFRTEIENPLVEKDIIELERKIHLFNEGKINDEQFRSLRLARGIYGQRQFGVQMIRIKLPYGKVSSEQLMKITDVSDEYSRGRLHITTRQDIQIHHVSLDRTPELWAELEKSDITLREACGNTVRNVTASPTAGIDPKEPFDVSPYADAVFKFFLRNPYCQEMGRKFKISFSGTEEDTALSYIHDLGFIAKEKMIDGISTRGFKVMVAGGLGSQPRQADVAYEFLETDKIIPFTEGLLRVFDRHGERTNRSKARFKFLVKDIGLRSLLDLVEAEQKAIELKAVPIETNLLDPKAKRPLKATPKIIIKDEVAFEKWKKSNIIEQKQTGYVAIGVRVSLGDFYTKEARKLAALIHNYAGNEIRLTLRQDFLIPYVPEDSLPFFYQELEKLQFTKLGYNSTQDITACPGTDTCNLGISSSTGIALELEKLIVNEYPEYIQNQDITIKISGCMNACGQHNMAHIGFQGMSMKIGDKIAPALQILLGGGVHGNGFGRFSDKVIKIPSKRGPQALRKIFDDFKLGAKNEDFLSYYDEKGKKYFYDLLKPLSDTSNLIDEDFIDWGHDNNYIKAIGIGECAGVMIDLVATLLFESEEKLRLANETIKEEQWADSIYHSYASIVNTAKSLLISEQVKTNTISKIITDFDIHFIETGKIKISSSFEDFVYQIRENDPSEAFAKNYLKEASEFYKNIDAYRLKIIQNDN